MTDAPHPLEFFRHLLWLDGKTPLLDSMEPYRQRLFSDALYTFEEDGTPQYNMVLSGRGKKNFKSSDLILAMFYRFLGWPSEINNDVFIVANDEDQAADDLTLAKRLVEVNPILAREVEVRAKEIQRVDGRGTLKILPAQDAVGAHGKTYLALGIDEMHGYRDWRLLEALAPDPGRPDALTWITSYDSLLHSPGAPLFDLMQAGKAGTDPRMLFSWYSGSHCTDREFADLPTAEERANPSLAKFSKGYLETQKRRLPTHLYRRLHLNEGGQPQGARFDADSILGCVAAGRREIAPSAEHKYLAFVDMSGGSSDDAVLGIAHHVDGKTVLDCLVKQNGRAPFNPRDAVQKFSAVLRRYGLREVTGDAYAGLTFRLDFEQAGFVYKVSAKSKSDLYDDLEPLLNAGEVELLDVPTLQEQLLSLVWRGAKTDHLPGQHDDFANGAAGALVLATNAARHGRGFKPIAGAAIGGGTRSAPSPFAVGNAHPMNWTSRDYHH